MDIYWLNKQSDLNLIRGKNLRRKFNSLMVGLSRRWSTSKVWGYPRHLILDVISSCGLKCPICPQGRKEIPRAPASLEPELFRRILDQLGPYLYTLTLTNWGEPLRYPHLIDLVKYARKWSIYIGFSTNLQNFNTDQADALLESDIDEIGCSIDGATEETYLTYRVGGQFQDAIDRMQYLVNQRNKIGRKRPKIRWQVLLNRYTEKEIDLIITRGRQIGVDSIVFVPIYVDIAGLFCRTPRERYERDKDWLPVNPDYSWYDYSTGLLKQIPPTCEKLWDTMIIHPDGSVSPCCGVINPDHDFGRISLQGESLIRIFNNAKYQSARRMIRTRTITDPELVCTHCLKNGVLIY